MVLPKWVTFEREMEAAVFQCPVCETEGEINISNYPKTQLRVVVDEWQGSVNGEGGY